MLCWSIWVVDYTRNVLDSTSSRIEDIVNQGMLVKIFFFFILISFYLPSASVPETVALSPLSPLFQLGRQISSCLENIRSLAFHKWIPVPATETSGECSLSLANYKLIKLTTFPSLCYAFRGLLKYHLLHFLI